MQPQILVVSDPPHRDVAVDTVAEVIGLDPEIVHLKLGFPAPEVLAATAPQRAHDIADALEEAGMSVVVIDGHHLASVPWAKLATDARVETGGLVARIEGEERKISFDAPRMGVYVCPPEGFTAEPRVDLAEAVERGGRDALADALEWTAHLDLYVDRNGVTERIVIVDEAPGIVDALERAAPRLDMDRRLEGVRPRGRFVAGDAGFDIDLRKAFSFGTLLLRTIMQSIDDELRDLPQYEFASRLSYVMRRRPRT